MFVCDSHISSMGVRLQRLIRTKATTKLVPGQRLKVAIYDITTRVTSGDNLKFIASQCGILTGAHGASLVWDQRRDELPKGRWYVSFDRKEVLWKDADGYHR